MKVKSIRVSVKELVGFCTGGGDISKGGAGSAYEDAGEGTAIHNAFQKKMENEHGEAFKSEAYLKDTIKSDEMELTVTGRADGVLETSSHTEVYEIKSTWRMPEDIREDENPAHWGQAVCYGHMLSTGRESEKPFLIRLLYINRETGESKSFEKQYTGQELGKLYKGFADAYIEWMQKVRKWESIRDSGIKNLSFPFSEYRPGQRQMAAGVYRAVKDGERLFVQAPTGTGKTVAALFPCIKAMGEGLLDRIFYLTAKTVTSGIAVENCKKLCAGGLNLRVILLTAKDKVCPLEKRRCDPDYCERAKGYYDWSKEEVEDLLANQFLERGIIREYADKYNICPFELALDASLYCDVVICDYNYLFDPRVRLIRFFAEVKEDYGFIIDEAHNLVDRGREMFSCELSAKTIAGLQRGTKEEWKDLEKRLMDLGAEIEKLAVEKFPENKRKVAAASVDLPYILAEKAMKCSAVMEGYLEEEMPEEYFAEFMDMYFNLLFFAKIASLYDDKFNTFYMRDETDIKIKLMCLDPSKLLACALDAGKGAVFFSATLQPVKYYRNLLGGREFDPDLLLPSPFPEENLFVAVEARISTKYRNRHLSYEDIAFLLRAAFDRRTGNYIVFFPSYKYLQEVLQIYEVIKGHAKTLVQKPGMDEQEREDFLQKFEEYGNRTLVAFAVMGGIFGEGVDLPGEKLSGAVVVGTGLPAVCNERELIRRYYDETNGEGFDYAYTYPGLNRVLQAAGRVIRSEKDKGFVILIDGRFAGRKYRDLFPSWWKPRYFTYGNESISEYIT